MVFGWLAFGIMMLLSIGLSAIQYLLRPKAQKGDVFDSKSYHTDGMQNSVEIGVPINVPYGTHKYAPQIRSYFLMAKGNFTQVQVVLSCGEGVIAGMRDIRLNDQPFFSVLKRKKKDGTLKNGYWLTLGEQIQKVYESSRPATGTLKYDVSPGFNQTITLTMPYSSHTKFQDASAAEPGYFELYNFTGAKINIESIEIIQYTGKQQEAGGARLQFTGCRIIKSHAAATSRVKQRYTIKKAASGAVLETIPGFTRSVVHHNTVNTEVKKGSPVTITTQNKIQAFAVTVGFEEGLYMFKKTGYKPYPVKISISWWKDGDIEGADSVPVTTTRAETADDGYYIALGKNTNYAWLVDTNGVHIEGSAAYLDENTKWEDIETNDLLEFTLGSNTYICKITGEVIYEPTDKTTYETNAEGYYEEVPVYRLKVKFVQQEPDAPEKYNGPKTSKVSYKITWVKDEVINVYKTTLPNGKDFKPQLASYRYTFILPNAEKFGNLEYAKYKIKVDKKTPNSNNPEWGVNKMTLIEIQEMTIDDLCYPHEALLALQFDANEKLQGSIDNITCIMEGRVLKDVQNTGNPDRLSSNFYDVIADVITNKRYGRGKELNLSSAELTDFYAKLAPEAAFCDHAITENSKARKRFEINLNVDFKKPTIDFLQALSITTRSNIYWDGAKPLAYIDRSTTPAAMFGSANTIPGSFRDESFDLSENVNRIYSQFLNRDKNYVHDNITRDFRDEGFTINKLRTKSITTYGITDRWRATKIDNYLLRFAKYVKAGCQFQTGGDGITIDIGKTFYYLNTSANCGRILAVGSNNITLDKAFTVESGKTYKALVRKDDGAPHAELTVDGAATGYGSKTLIFFTQTISGVTLATNPIYGIGISGEYYDTYRCVQKDPRGSAYEIAGALYDPETYRLYKNDPSSDLSITPDTDETETLPTALDNASMSPPNIISLAVRENTTAIGMIDIYITRPVSAVWSYADIYISEEEDGIVQYAGTTRGGPLRVTKLKLNVEYTVRATSYNAKGMANPHPFEVTVTLAGTEPQVVVGLKIINNKGTASEVFGRDFEVMCAGMTSDLSHAFVKQTNEYEGLRYLWQVYYTGTTANGIPDSVKLGGQRVNQKEAYRLVSKDNIFKFSLENNIERIKAMYASYATDANYAAYYGNPRREVTVKVSLINAWGKPSPAATELVMLNPPPDMKDAAGVVITPTLRKIKGGLRIEWTHPDAEYDITDFIVRLAKDAAFTVNLKRVKVISTITTDSSDDDISLAKYKTEIDGLDIKQTYYVQVIPRDPFGKGAASNIVSGTPGITNDDDELDLARPTRYDYTKLTVTADTEINDDGKTVTNLICKGEKASESDVDGYVLEMRMVKDTAAVTPPTGAEIDAGITAGGKKCEGNTYQIGIDGEAGTGTTDTNYWKKKIHDVKNNWTAFFRARKQNTSGQKGAWSSDSPGAWVSFVTTKTNNASDTTAPAAPTVAVTQEGQSVGITASIASPPADLQGFQFAVKSTAFTGDADRLSNKHADIDASAGKAKDTFYGVAGSSYYISSRSYDFSKNYSAWVDYASNPVELAGLTLDSLSEPISMAIYTGPLTAGDADTVSWPNGYKVKIKRTGGATKEYTISSGSTGNLAGTRYIVFNKATSTTAFSVVTTPGDDDTVIAKVEPVTSGKANISRYVGEKEGEYSIGRYSGAFNQLSALIAFLGKVVIQHGDEGSLNFLDSANKTAIRLKVNSGADPDFVIMKSGQDADGNGGADASDPTKVAFSTKLVINAVTVKPTSKLVIDEFIYTIPNVANWQNIVVAAETTSFVGIVYLFGALFPSGYGITQPREVKAMLFNASASAQIANMPAFGSTVDSTDACFQYVEVIFVVSEGQGLVKLQRVCSNPTGGSLTLPSLVGNSIKVTVYADLVG